MCITCGKRICKMSKNHMCSFHVWTVCSCPCEIHVTFLHRHLKVSQRTVLILLIKKKKQRGEWIFQQGLVPDHQIHCILTSIDHNNQKFSKISLIKFKWMLCMCVRICKRKEKASASSSVAQWCGNAFKIVQWWLLSWLI